MNIENFCEVFDNVLDFNACDRFVELFNENQVLLERLDSNYTPALTQLDFTRYKHLDEHLHEYVVSVSLHWIKQYRDLVPETKFWPKNFSFENFRIKRYVEGGYDRFDEHVDSCDMLSSKRFFSFFWYLNDVDEGGETVFTNINLKVKPKKGTLLMFPPLWMFPHVGNPVIKGEKFILHSYLHYDNRC